ncbi:hypothetical protein MSPP1_002242 [Malassezia sp. CBS 17886]|nr:hypothetical protein MSPP1_002242 [Malassezia sp. CBS 17886]
MAKCGVSGPLARMVAWVALSVFQFGFGVSELNAVQALLPCARGARPADCAPLSAAAFGYVTAMFTVGGTVASLLCAPAARYTRSGRRTCLLVADALCAAGGLCLATASTAAGLAAGRLLQGLCAGIAIVQVPVYLQEIAPPPLAGEIGIMNQVAVVVGIFVAQAIGTCVTYSATLSWALVPCASVAVAVAHAVVGNMWAVESPGWLDHEGASLVGQVAHERAAAIPGGNERAPAASPDSPSFWDGMRVVLITLVAQQLSGVNAILSYSTGILGALLPRLAGGVGLFITLVNGALTFPPIWLISEDRVGRRNLLLFSAGGMAAASLVLAWSIWLGYAALSAVAIVACIAFFSDVSFGSSLALGASWVTNIIVAAGFPPLRAAFGRWDGGTGGLVFVPFAAVNFVTVVLVARLYKGPGARV